MIIAKQSTSRTIQLGPFVDSTDGYTPESGLSVTQATVKLSKAGAVFAQKNDSNSGTYDANGYYRVALNTTDTNTVGMLRVSCQITGALPVEENLLILPAAIYEALINSGPYGSVWLRSTVASVTSQTNLTLNTSYMSDNLVGGRITIRRATTGQVITGIITDTTAGEEVTFTVDGTADYTIVSGDIVELSPPTFSIAKLLATVNGAATVATQLAKLDAAVSSVAASPAQVLNREPVPALTAKLGTRSDGVMVAYPTLRIAPGEITQVWVDCSKLSRDNIEDLSNAASSHANIDVDSSGVYRSYATFVLNGTDAVDGDATVITADVQPATGQKFKLTLNVTTDAE